MKNSLELKGSSETTFIKRSWKTVFQLSGVVLFIRCIVHFLGLAKYIDRKYSKLVLFLLGIYMCECVCVFERETVLISTVHREYDILLVHNGGV